MHQHRVLMSKCKLVLTGVKEKTTKTNIETPQDTKRKIIPFLQNAPYIFFESI